MKLRREWKLVLVLSLFLIPLFKFSLATEDINCPRFYLASDSTLPLPYLNSFPILLSPPSCGEREKTEQLCEYLAGYQPRSNPSNSWSYCRRDREGLIQPSELLLYMQRRHKPEKQNPARSLCIAYICKQDI